MIKWQYWVKHWYFKCCSGNDIKIKYLWNLNYCTCISISSDVEIHKFMHVSFINGQQICNVYFVIHVSIKQQTLFIHTLFFLSLNWKLYPIVFFYQIYHRGIWESVNILASKPFENRKWKEGCLFLTICHLLQ